MTAQSASSRVLLFVAGGEQLAMPADDVVEITIRPPMTRLPLAPASLRGLANMRGTVVPVMSLAQLLAHSAGDEGRLVLLGGATRVGLLVDDVSTLADRLGSERLVDPRALIEGAFAGFGDKLGKSSTAIDRENAVGVDSVPTVALLAFTVAGQLFGLPLAQAREVLPVPAEVAALPHGSRSIAGTIAHRNHLVPLLDLRALLGLEQGARGERSRVLLTRIGRHIVGLLIDSVMAVLHVSEDDIDPLPPVLARGAAEARIQAICRLDGGNRLVSVLSSEQLLDDEVTAQLAQGGGDTDMQAAPSGDGDEEDILLFAIGDDSFGLPISAVREVTRRPERLTSLPRAPAFVDGIMNLRGQALPVIDQRRRFGTRAEDGAGKPVIVVTIGGTQAGFVVDTISRVASIPSSRLQPSPDLGNEKTPVIDRVAALEVDGRLVLMVNPQELLDRAERDLLTAMKRPAKAKPAS